MRALFSSTRGAGHFNPLVPFARAFLRVGHEVVVAGPRLPELPPEEANRDVVGSHTRASDEAVPLLERLDRR